MKDPKRCFPILLALNVPCSIVLLFHSPLPRNLSSPNIGRLWLLPSVMAVELYSFGWEFLLITILTIHVS